MMRRPTSGSNARVAAGLVAFMGLMASYPVYVATRGSKLQASERALGGDALIRGAYVNTGSKDVGPDPAVHTSRQ
ncbi:hypothetical protein ACKKBG_A29675 [Auxenochlorella protothecoides x Auxenochlorella symbiontica]